MLTCLLEKYMEKALELLEIRSTLDVSKIILRSFFFNKIERKKGFVEKFLLFWLIINLGGRDGRALELPWFWAALSKNDSKFEINPFMQHLPLKVLISTKTGQIASSC